MLVDAMMIPTDLRSASRAAADVYSSGFGGLVLTETTRNAFMGATAVNLGAPELRISTGVAVAFPRSPMVTAGAAWELAEATEGRFRLGLGTQVRAHVERRYASEFDPPGPRLAEYVRAVKAAFAAFRGEPLAFEGQWWSLSLLPSAWSPGPIDVPDPPVDVAAVNPWMLRMAGEVADGVHVHPLNHEQYITGTVIPEVAVGADRVGRDPSELKLFVPVFTVVGDDEAERSRWREMARTQVAFYGSTPNYAFLFDQIGAEGTTAAVRERQRSGDIGAMAEVITDEILANFIVEGTWEELPAKLVARHGTTASSLVLYFANPAFADPATMQRFGEVARQVEALSA